MPMHTGAPTACPLRAIQRSCFGLPRATPITSAPIARTSSTIADPSTRRRRPSAPVRPRRRRPAPAAQHVGGAVGHAGRSAEEAQPPPLLGGPASERRHQVGAGRALPDRGPHEPRPPDDPHAVGDRQVGRPHGRAQPVVGSRVDDEVDVDGGDLVHPSVRRPSATIVAMTSSDSSIVMSSIGVPSRTAARRTVTPGPRCLAGRRVGRRGACRAGPPLGTGAQQHPCPQPQLPHHHRRGVQQRPVHGRRGLGEHEARHHVHGQRRRRVPIPCSGRLTPRSQASAVLATGRGARRGDEHGQRRARGDRAPRRPRRRGDRHPDGPAPASRGTKRRASSMRPRSQRSFWVRGAFQRRGHRRLDDGVGRVGDEHAVEQELVLELDVLGEVVGPGARRSTSVRNAMPLPNSPHEPPSAVRPSGRRWCRRASAALRSAVAGEDRGRAPGTGPARRSPPPRAAAATAPRKPGATTVSASTMTTASIGRPARGVGEHRVEQPLQRRALAAAARCVLAYVDAGRPRRARPCGRCSGRRRRGPSAARPGSRGRRGRRGCRR